MNNHLPSPQVIGVDESSGKDKTILVARVGPDIKFFRDLFDGETWIVHPSGNGIVVAHPDRPPMWCRCEDDQYRQDFIAPEPSP